MFFRGWACLLHCKVAFRIVSCTPEPLPSASLQGLVEGLLVKDQRLLHFRIPACRHSRPAGLPPQASDTSVFEPALICSLNMQCLRLTGPNPAEYPAQRFDVAATCRRRAVAHGAPASTGQEH